jgi:hypothetical protein
MDFSQRGEAWGSRPKNGHAGKKPTGGSIRG